MSSIDKQRIEAVRELEQRGFTFAAGAWAAPASEPPGVSLSAEADAMHALLVLRADKLGGCTEGSEESAELEMISDTVEAYETKRWPNGKIPGGKG